MKKPYQKKMLQKKMLQEKNLQEKISFKRMFPVSFLLFSLSLIPIQLNAGSFDKETLTGTLAIGSGQLYTEDYLVVGLGAGYFITDGFQVGLDVNFWTGGEPSIYEVTPKLTYVFDNRSSVKPYLGMFYNRTFIDGLDDTNSLGYRAGFYSPVGEKAYVGIGAVYTELQDCTETSFVSCSSTYTELSFVFTL